MPGEDLQARNHAQIYLQPIAAPSILGLYGLAGATFIVAAHMVHWFGTGQTALFLFPFAAIFGGLAQFLAGMWAFWMAYGILYVMFAAGKLAQPAGASADIGFWYIVLAAITWVSVLAASAENRATVVVLAFLAAGSTTAAIGELSGATWLMLVTGYLFIIASIAAWYAGSALMLEEAFGKEIWSLGKSRVSQEMGAVDEGVGEPGVVRGQAYVRT
jgi:succinate-acetate transporter protein